ncbi:MAG TPA: GntR family transcriptional regulator [Terriglobia bacterium]|nr:GntR family transcriptional regulator [Terriglobia bacterium]
MSTTFQKLEPVSKKVRIVTLLREAMVSGGIKGGEQIVEAKIAQQFGVGQGLIREALIELEHQGFVRRTPFSGTHVHALDLKDAQQIFEMRIELEPLAFSLAVDNASDEDVAELADLVEKTKIAAAAGDLDSFFDSHLAFRKTMWKLSGNIYVQQALERIVIPLYALYLMRQSYNRNGLFQTITDCIEHEDKILAALRKRDSKQARRVACDFLTRMRDYLATRLVPGA